MGRKRRRNGSSWRCRHSNHSSKERGVQLRDRFLSFTRAKVHTCGVNNRTKVRTCEVNNSTSSAPQQGRDLLLETMATLDLVIRNLLWSIRRITTGARG